jgi:hypothetical protein
MAATKKSRTRIVTTTSSTHCLSFGQLRQTPLGNLSMEQLESAETLLDLEQTKAEATGDTVAEKRLAVDERELKAELERRNLHAA